MNNGSPFDINSYTGIGQIASIFGMYLPDIIDDHPNVRILTSDMSYGARLERFKSLYPELFINVGIAEQNLIGVSAGLASEGFKCVALAQATFISMRSFEQVRQYLSYMHSNIILVGLSAGFALQFMGNSHYSIEDIAIMRSLPNLVVLSPADASEAVKAFAAALQINAPVYLRLTGEASTPLVYKEDYSFSIGKSNVIRAGQDITIFATGSMVYQSLMAAEYLKEMGISAKIVNVHTLKPLDTETIDHSKKSQLFISVEEHNIIGGLGSAIAEYISEYSDFPPLLKLGIKDKYSVVGDYQYLLEQHRLIPAMIAEDILRKINTK